MKPKFLLAFCLLSINAFSQGKRTTQVQIDAKYLEVGKTFLSSVGLDLNMPIGDWQDFYGPAAGIFYEGRWLANNNISIFGDVGYNYISGQEYDGLHHLYFIPGIRVNILKNFYSYVGAGPNYVTLDRDDELSLGFDLGLGIDLITSKKKPLANGIPIFGIRAGVTSFKFDEDYRTSLGIKLIMTLTKARDGKK